jgi:hypothetical protein
MEWYMNSMKKYLHSMQFNGEERDKILILPMPI